MTFFIVNEVVALLHVRSTCIQISLHLFWGEGLLKFYNFFLFHDHNLQNRRSKVQAICGKETQFCCFRVDRQKDMHGSE